MFSAQASTLPYIGVMAALALVPLFFMVSTAFVKVHVVLGIFRNALGGQQIPSGAVLGAISLALTLCIMTPTLEACVVRAYEGAQKNATSSAGETRESAPSGEKGKTERKRASKETAGDSAVSGVAQLLYALEPLKLFLERHINPSERAYFETVSQRLADSRQSTTPAATNLNVTQPSKNSSVTAVALDIRAFVNLLPAFLFSELKAAFTLGVRIYLPFLILDLVVANVLLALGLAMVNPITIALPLKLLVFVVADGWLLLCEALVKSYLP